MATYGLRKSGITVTEVGGEGGGREGRLRERTKGDEVTVYIQTC